MAPVQNPFSNPKALAGWIEQQPAGDEFAAAIRLITLLRDSLELRIAPSQRLDVLEKLLHTSQVTQDNLMRHYAGGTAPLRREQWQAASLRRELLVLFTQHHQVALVEQSQKLFRFNASPNLTALHRAMRLGTEVVFHDAAVYQTTSAAWWRELLSLFLLGRQQRLVDEVQQDTVVGDTRKYSVANLYAAAVLFHISAPLGFSASEQENWRRFIERRVERLHLELALVDSRAHGMMIPVQGDGVPGAMSLTAAMTEQQVIVLHADALILRLEELLQQNQSDSIDLDLGAGSMPRHTLVRLVERLRMVTSRRDARTPVQRPVRLWVGIRDIYAALTAPVQVSIEDKTPAAPDSAAENPDAPPGPTQSKTTMTGGGEPEWKQVMSKYEHQFGDLAVRGLGAPEERPMLDRSGFNIMPTDAQPDLGEELWELVARNQAANEAEVSASLHKSEQLRPGSVPERGAEQRWTTLNSSRSGFRLRWMLEGTCRVRVGDMVALSSGVHEVKAHEAQIQHGRLGLVRWLDQQQDGSMDIGVETIGRNIRPVLVRRPGGEGDFVFPGLRGEWIAGGQEPGGIEFIALLGQSSKNGDPLLLSEGGGSFVPSVLERQLEQGAGFSIHRITASASV